MKRSFYIFKRTFLIFTLSCIVFSLAACSNTENKKNQQNKSSNIKLEVFKDETTGLYGYKDNEGNIVIPCTFERAGDFSNDRAVVEKDARFGFIDKQGNMVIPCIYKEAGDFSNGRALVRSEGKLGFIDTNGNAVTGFIFDNATNFNAGGYATVIENGISYDIDKNGNRIAQQETSDIEKTSEN